MVFQSITVRRGKFESSLDAAVVFRNLSEDVFALVVCSAGPAAVGEARSSEWPVGRLRRRVVTGPVVVDFGIHSVRQGCSPIGRYVCSWTGGRRGSAAGTGGGEVRGTGT